MWRCLNLSFVKVISKSELAPGVLKGVMANEKPILLSNLEGKYYAIGNICTHRGCKLSNGTLSNEIVQCACHGSRFDVKTGKVVGGPAGRSEPAYNVKVEGNDILVEV